MAEKRTRSSNSVSSSSVDRSGTTGERSSSGRTGRPSAQIPLNLNNILRANPNIVKNAEHAVRKAKKAKVMTTVTSNRQTSSTSGPPAKRARPANSMTNSQLNRRLNEVHRQANRSYSSIMASLNAASNAKRQKRAGSTMSNGRQGNTSVSNLSGKTNPNTPQAMSNSKTRTLSNVRTVTTQSNISSNGNTVNTAGYDPYGLNRKLSPIEKYTIPKSYFNHQEQAVEQLAKRSSKAFYDLKKGRMANGAVQYRGGLVWHGTGSGKTVTGLGILLQYLKISEELERKGIPAPYLCVVTTIANERQNGMNTYLRNLMRHHPEYALELAREQHHMIASNQTIKIFRALKKVFTKRVKFFTYQKFASCLGLFGRGNIQQDTVCNEMRTTVINSNGKKIPQYLQRGMVVILDESQELIKADMNDLKEVKNNKPIKNQYQSILQTKKMILENVKNPFVHVYCLTATPGTSIQEYVDTLNLVRPANMPKLDESSVFKHEIRKFVHRVDLSGNPNYFASTTKERREVPISKEHYLLTLGFIRKHEGQENKHIQSLSTGKKTTSKSAQLVYRYFHREAYMAEARRMENWIRHSPNNEFDYYGVKCFEKVKKQPMIPTKKGVRVPKPKAPRRIPGSKITEYIAKQYYGRIRNMLRGNRDGLERLRKLFPDGRALLKLGRSMTVVVTPKLFKVAHYIVNTKGKQFVYSNDPVSNQIIATMISIMYGFEDVTNRVLNLQLQYRDPNSNNTNMPNRNTHIYRRYILSNDPGGKGIETFQAFMSGLNMEKEGARRIPEDPTEAKFMRNAHGEMCKIIFVTGELYTGVDINALRGVHLLNPFASKVSDMQARGRAARSKGHMFLNDANRNAKIFEYVSTVNAFGGTKPTIESVLKCLRHEKKTWEGFMSAYQWIMGRSKISGAIRVSGKNVMRLDKTTEILPTADSLVERQQKFDVHAKRLEQFERELKRHLIKTKSAKK